MSKLAEIQSKFMASLRQQDRQLEAEIITSSDKHSQERIQIYQEGYLYRLQNALVENLPLFAQSLAAEELTKIYQAYIFAQPSESYAIQTYGHLMAEFMRNYQHLPQALCAACAEIIELDLALLKASRAADQPPFSWQQLQQIPAEEWPSISLNLQTNLTIVKFDYNVCQQWATGKILATELTPLESAQTLLIWRKGITNHYRKLTQHESSALNFLNNSGLISADEFYEWLSKQLSDPLTLFLQLIRQWAHDETLQAAPLVSSC